MSLAVREGIYNTLLATPPRDEVCILKHQTISIQGNYLIKENLIGNLIFLRNIDMSRGVKLKQYFVRDYVIKRMCLTRQVGN